MIVFLTLLFSLFSAVLSQPPRPKGLLINCGANSSSVIDGALWLPDAQFLSSQFPSFPETLNLPGLLPTLSTVRTFPFRKSDAPRKFCYYFPVFRGAKYLVRTTYFYGGVNGQDAPPVFDQMVDGMIWIPVNTTVDYARSMSSYYEGVYLARGKKMSVCLGGNGYTDSNPFISSVELIVLEDSVYNTTDFNKYAMSLVARSDFREAGPILRYPDDQFDRYWQPFTESMLAVKSSNNISASGFWNLPPSKVLETALMADQTNTLDLQWPLIPLQNGSYYIALYFADPVLGSSRVLDISINGVNFYHSLNVRSFGATVFATRWNLSGLTEITLTSSQSSLPALINGGEVFGILTLGGLTVARDVIALERVKNSIQNPPLDWTGDPCLPREYSWTGITCSEGSRVRVIALNLSSMQLSGTLSPTVANLTALTDILLRDNNLSGPIPDLSRLRRLTKLHLQDNQFSGTIPPSLAILDSLREVFLQNNNLTGDIPRGLEMKPGLNLQTSPGNHFSSPSPP